MADRRRDRVLAEDLSTRTVEREAVPESWLERYLDGKGLGARYLYDRLEADVDLLGPGERGDVHARPALGLSARPGGTPSPRSRR